MIEVNIQPASSWPELVEIVTTVYDEARPTRLGTEKFQLDGTHTGTGGGNHMTLGGPTPADSPLLRRPDLLRSLITYWQHHPSLSYLFSGRFIGPTSQAPRVDEARDDSLYELEIAFAELDRPERIGRALARRPPAAPSARRRDRQHPPGRVLHRQAVQPRQRAGPPRPGRAAGLRDAAPPADGPGAGPAGPGPGGPLLAQPYSGELVRWGSELHDRFLLPWYVAADIADVVDDLAGPRAALRTTWLAPFLEFRFPRLGSVQVARHHHRAADGHRAVARPRRGGRPDQHRALRRLVGRAASRSWCRASPTAATS